MIMSPFPYFTIGTVVHGFARGSKELGCPTANLDDTAVENLPESIDQGVYYGWAQLLLQNDVRIYKMVASIGKNPFYSNERKTIEAHLIHEFSENFYGEKLKLVLLGEIRKMATYKNASELIKSIQNDIIVAKHELDSDECRQYLSHTFFTN